MQEEPAFKWWVSEALRTRNRFIGKVKKQYWKTSHKFGVKLQNSVQEALQIVYIQYNKLCTQILSLQTCRGVGATIELKQQHWKQGGPLHHIWILEFGARVERKRQCMLGRSPPLEGVWDECQPEATVASWQVVGSLWRSSGRVSNRSNRSSSTSCWWSCRWRRVAILEHFWDMCQTEATVAAFFLTSCWWSCHWRRAAILV